MRSRVAVAGMACLLAVLTLADTVSIPDKMELSGKKIEILEIRESEVLVRVPYGDIVIPRSRVTGMKVDFAERVATLKEQGADTSRSLFNLGRVCAQLEMPKEAAAAYREAFARRDVPEDLLLPLAAELEVCEDWAAAHQCYAAYLKLHPESAEVAAKARAAAAKAAAAVPAPETPIVSDVKIDSTLPPPKPGQRPVRPAQPDETPDEQPVEQPAQPGEVPPEAPKEQEGLEARAGWTTEAWGSSVEINVGPPQGTTDKMVRVFLAGAEQDKACVLLEEDLDLTNQKALTFEVYNFAKQTVTLAVAFTTSPGWKFYESMPVMVMPTGNNPKSVSVNLLGARFKSAETQWRHRTTIQNKNRVVKFYFLLYTKQTGSWVFFNNIRFEPAEAAAAEPPAGPAPPAPAPALKAPAPAPKAPAPAPRPAPAPAPEPAAPAPKAAEPAP